MKFKYRDVRFAFAKNLERMPEVLIAIIIANWLNEAGIDSRFASLYRSPWRAPLASKISNGCPAASFRSQFCRTLGFSSLSSSPIGLMRQGLIRGSLRFTALPAGAFGVQNLERMPFGIVSFSILSNPAGFSSLRHYKSTLWVLL